MSVRIRLDLSQVSSGENQWVLVDFSRFKTIGDFAEHLRHSVVKTSSNFQLFLQECLLPNFEPIKLLQNGDFVSLKSTDSLEPRFKRAKVTHRSPVCTSGPAPRRKRLEYNPKQESSSSSTSSSEDEEVQANRRAKEAKKQSSSSSSSSSSDSEEETPKVLSSAEALKSKVKSSKVKQASGLKPSKEESYSTSSSSEQEETLKSNKQKQIIAKKTKPESSSSSTSSSDDEPDLVVRPKKIKTDPSSSSSSSSEEEAETTKDCSMTDLSIAQKPAEKPSQAMSSQQQQPTETQTKRKRKRKRKPKNKNKLPPDHHQSFEMPTQETPEIATKPNEKSNSSQKPQLNGKSQEIEPTKQARKLGSSYPMVTCEEEILQVNGSSTPRPVQKSRQNSVFNTPRNAPSENRISSPFKNGLENLLSLAATKNPVTGTRNKAEARPPFENLPKATWDQLKTGKTLAFKVLEMSSSYEPHVSDFKSGEILELNDPDQVSVQLDEKPIEKTGRFEMNGDEDHDDNSVATYSWSDLIDPKILM